MDLVSVWPSGGVTKGGGALSSPPVGCAESLQPPPPPEVHSDEVYCMDYISDMKVSDATQLTSQGGLLFIQDTWKPDWEKPIQVSASLGYESR